MVFFKDGQYERCLWAWLSVEMVTLLSWEGPHVKARVFKKYANIFRSSRGKKKTNVFCKLPLRPFNYLPNFRVLFTWLFASTHFVTVLMKRLGVPSHTYTSHFLPLFLNICTHVEFTSSFLSLVECLAWCPQIKKGRKQPPVPPRSPRGPRPTRSITKEIRLPRFPWKKHKADVKEIDMHTCSSKRTHRKKAERNRAKIRKRRGVWQPICNKKT